MIATTTSDTTAIANTITMRPMAKTPITELMDARNAESAVTAGVGLAAVVCLRAAGL